MFKYLNPISKTLKRIKINNNANMNFISITNNESLKATFNPILGNYNNLMKIPNKNIFSKLFNKGKDKTQEADKLKNEDKLKNLKYQDKDGKLNLNNSEANQGEYSFSYNTETDKNANYDENDIDEVYKNPEESLDATFSKQFLKIDTVSANNKREKQTKISDSDNNFVRLSKLIEFNLPLSTPSIVNQYQSLKFEADLASYVKEMNNLGFNNQLLRSIFRKNFYFFLEKQNIELCKNLSAFLEKSFKFNPKESVEIIACIPEVLKVSNKQIEDNHKLIKEFLNLDNDKTNKLILEYPSILAKSNPDALKKIELYFNIYLGYEKADLQKLYEKNPLLFNIDADNTLEIMKAIVTFGLKKEEFREFIEKDSKLFLFKSSHFKNIFIYLKKFDIKAGETFNILKKYPEMVLANRHSLLMKKISLLSELVPQKSTLRTLIKMYPFILLKSYNSFVRKILYFNKELEKNILELDIFPIIFLFNFQRDIKPRCELMRKYNNWIPFKEAFALSPEEFSKQIGASLDEYNSFVEDSSPLYERDLLYRYNKYYGI